MSASHAPAIESPLSQLVEGFIKVLTNERGASSHTLRAYEREFMALHRGPRKEARRD